MNWRFWGRSEQPADKTCLAIQSLLSLHIDGMTSPEEKGRLERHLGECDECRRAWEWVQATNWTLSQRPAAVPPVDMPARIARAIAASSPAAAPVRPARRPLILRPALVAVASALVVGVMASHWLRSAGPLPTPPVTRPPVVAVKPPVAPVPTERKKTASRIARAAAPKTGVAHREPRVRSEQEASAPPTRLKTVARPPAVAERVPVRVPPKITVSRPPAVKIAGNPAEHANSGLKSAAKRHNDNGAQVASRPTPPPVPDTTAPGTGGGGSSAPVVPSPSVSPNPVQVASVPEAARTRPEVEDGWSTVRKKASDMQLASSRVVLPAETRSTHRLAASVDTDAKVYVGITHSDY